MGRLMPSRGCSNGWDSGRMWVRQLELSVTLDGLIIGSGEGSMVGLSLVLTLEYPLESPNHGADLPGMLMGAPLGLWSSSDMVWGVVISCVPPSVSFIKSNMNSVRHWQLLELLALSLSPTWLIPNYGGRQISAEISSTGFMTFKFGLDKDSSILTAELSSWVNLLGPLVGWDSHSLGVKFNLLKDSSRISVAVEPVGFWLGYELGLSLGDLIDSETCPPVGLQLIVDIPPGSKVRYPDLVVSPSRATLVVPPSGYYTKFLPPPSGTCLTYLLRAVVAANISLGGDQLLLSGGGAVDTSTWPKEIRKHKINQMAWWAWEFLLCLPYRYRMWMDFEWFSNPFLVGYYLFYKWKFLSISQFCFLWAT